jgi:hypothetical protein
MLPGPFYQDLNGSLDIGGNPIPQLLGQRWLSPHDAALHISATQFTQVWGVNGHLLSFCILFCARIYFAP